MKAKMSDLQDTMLDMLTLNFQFIKRQYLASFIRKNDVHEMILYSVFQ